MCIKCRAYFADVWDDYKICHYITLARSTLRAAVRIGSDEVKSTRTNDIGYKLPRGAARADAANKMQHVC